MAGEDISPLGSSKLSPSIDVLQKTSNLNLNFNLSELERQASAVFSKKWTRTEKIPGGANHELYMLFFETPSPPGEGPPTSEWSCIARVPRPDAYRSLEMLKSELVTMRYVAAKTTIPIPVVYYANFDPVNTVGTPYMLIEYIPGRYLHDIWYDPATTLEHKASIVTQTTGILAQLSTIEFPQIGSLDTDEEGNITVGPLLDACYESKTCGPFDNTLTYLTSYMPAEADIGDSPILKFLFRHIRHRLTDYLSQHSGEPHITPPFRLIHANLSSSSLIFGPPFLSGGAPRLEGVLDWEGAYVGPLYNLYEYPLFLHDSGQYPTQDAENEVLRAHFLQALVAQWERGGADADTAERCMKEKCHLLNRFMWVFMYAGDNGLEEAEKYMEEMRQGTGKAYPWSQVEA